MAALLAAVSVPVRAQVASSSASASSLQPETGILQAQIDALSARLEKEEKKTSGWEKLLDHLPAISGYTQIRYQYGSENLSSFDIWRVRLNLAGDISPKFDYKLQFEFISPKVIDAYVRFKPHNAFNIQLGQFLVPFSLEGPMSPLALETVDNPSVIASVCGAEPDTRDIGIAFYGGFLPKDGYNILDYSVGLFNGEGKNKADANKSKDVMGRININPLKSLTFSGSVSYGERSETFVKNLRYAAGFQWKSSALLVRSEYLGLDKTVAGAEYRTRGAYVLAGVPLQCKLTPLVRYSYFHRQGPQEEAGRHSAYLAGFDYQPLKYLRLQANYTYTHFNGLPQGDHLLGIVVTGIF